MLALIYFIPTVDYTDQGIFIAAIIGWVWQFNYWRKRKDDGA